MIRTVLGLPGPFRLTPPLVPRPGLRLWSGFPARFPPVPQQQFGLPVRFESGQGGPHICGWARDNKRTQLDAGSHVLGLGLLFALAPPPILVVPVGTGVTSGLARAWRVFALPALGWPTRCDFLGQGDGLPQLAGFLSFGAPLDGVDLVRDPVLLGAFLAPCLPLDGRLAAVSADPKGLGLDAMLVVIEPLSGLSSLGREWNSLLFGLLWCGYSVGSVLVSIVCFRGRLVPFLLASLLGPVFLAEPFYLKNMLAKIPFCTAHPHAGIDRKSVLAEIKAVGLPRSRGDRPSLRFSMTDSMVVAPAHAGIDPGQVAAPVITERLPQLRG